MPLTQLGRRRPSNTPATLISESGVWASNSRPQPRDTADNERAAPAANSRPCPAPSEGALAGSRSTQTLTGRSQPRKQPSRPPPHAVNDRDVIKRRQQPRAPLGRRGEMTARGSVSAHAFPRGRRQQRAGREVGRRRARRLLGRMLQQCPCLARWGSISLRSHQFSCCSRMSFSLRVGCRFCLE